MLTNIPLALRGLRRRPVYAAAVVLTLAVGIGATTAAFALVDAVFITRLPVRDQDRLAIISATPPARWSGSGIRWTFPWGISRILQERRRAFEGVGVYQGGEPYPYAARYRDRVVHVGKTSISGDFFTVLGVRPELGRLIQPEDDVPGGPSLVVLSDQIWRTQFGGDPKIIGQTIFFAQAWHRVIGVAPPEFTYPGATSVWVPARQEDYKRSAQAAESFGSAYYFVARLRPGVRAQTARQEVNAALRVYTPTGPDTLGVGALPPSGVIESYTDDVLGKTVRPGVLVLFAAIVLVLVIACTNVAGLLLARGIARSGEIAVRSALGAGRQQLVAYLLTESGLLALVGGVLGLALAVVLVRAAVALAPTELPMISGAHINPIVLVFAASITLGSVLGFGLIPALRGSRAELHGAVRSSGRSGTGNRQTGLARRVLVGVQVALALVVLSSAALLGRTLDVLRHVSLGFDPTHLLLYQLDFMLPAAPARDTSAAAAAHWHSVIEQLSERVPATPGLGPMTTTMWRPFMGEQNLALYTVDGARPRPGTPTPQTYWDDAWDDYFGVLRIPVLAGRTFSAHDDRGAPPVVIVSASLARREWPGQSAIGHRIRFVSDSVDRWWTIVGVAADTHFDQIGGPPHPTAYVNARQGPWNGPWFVVRTTGDPDRANTTLQRVIDSVDPAFGISRSTTGPDLLKQRLARPRALAALFEALAGTAVLLAALGLFGILSAYVRERTREIAIRSALGATPAQLRRLVVGQTIIVAGAGLVAGLPFVVGSAHLLRSAIRDVQPASGPMVALVALLIVGVVAVTTYAPTVQASRIDARTALSTD